VAVSLQNEFIPAEIWLDTDFSISGYYGREPMTNVAEPKSVVVMVLKKTIGGLG